MLTPETERKSMAGRKPIDAIVLFRMLILQSLYNLSDEQIEYQVRDRLSFTRFLTFGIEDCIPDGRYERSQARQDTRAGSYERTRHTKAGDVSLKVPKLRRQTFETAIIERYRRRESSVEEALIEMYLAGILVRRVEDTTEAL